MGDRGHSETLPPFPGHRTPSPKHRDYILEAKQGSNKWMLVWLRIIPGHCLVIKKGPGVVGTATPCPVHVVIPKPSSRHSPEASGSSGAGC